jgi:release factor glutamine methyltransferase
MPKIFEVYNQAVHQGKDQGVLSADIRLLIAHDEGFAEPIDTLYHKDDEMAHIDLFNSQFAELLKGKPVEYILHEARFLNHKIYVDENVLIPRMETEELIADLSERIYDYYDPRNYLVVADVGTGSGAIALSLKSIFPNWILLASDISEGALNVARNNFKAAGLSITSYQGPSLQPYIDRKTNLDIIVCNPPYITNADATQESVKNYEPASALWLDKKHSVYEEIFRDYKQVKKGTLLMCFEIGYDLKPYLTDLMAKYLEDYEFEFINDLNGQLRFLFVFLK